MVSYVELSQSSTLLAPPDPPVGFNTATYMTPIILGVSPEKKLRKVTINSLRINVLEYNCGFSELNGSLSFSDGSIGRLTIFPLNEDSEIEIMDPKLLDALEEIFKSGKQAELSLKAYLPLGVEFDIQFAIVMNTSLEYVPSFKIP